MLPERVRRQLLVNGEADFDALMATVVKIARNIVDHPDDDKYRHVRASSRALASRVLIKPGGRELITFAGFRNADIDELAFEASSDHASAVIDLCMALKWVPAEVDLAIRLPSGQTLRGAFLRTETVSDVLTYIGRPCVLQTHQGRLDPSQTLDSLAPRSMLVATIPETTVVVQDVVVAAADDDDARRRSDQRKLRKATIERHRDAQKQRSDAIRNFYADRDEAKERLERKKV